MNAIGMTGSVEDVKNPHAIPFGIPEQSKDCLEMQPIRWGALVMLAEMRSWNLATGASKRVEGYRQRELGAPLGIEAFGEAVAALFPNHSIPPCLEELTALDFLCTGEVSIFVEEELRQRG